MMPLSGSTTRVAPPPSALPPAPASPYAPPSSKAAPSSARLATLVAAVDGLDTVAVGGGGCAGRSPNSSSSVGAGSSLSGVVGGRAADVKTLSSSSPACPGGRGAALSSVSAGRSGLCGRTLVGASSPVNALNIGRDGRVGGSIARTSPLSSGGGSSGGGAVPSRLPSASGSPAKPSALKSVSSPT